ncbi:ABC transporter permease [Methanobacterium sp. ACI-7]|uniref:ABC transporter permease n=1 Tax=Methanobacterium sp. ACI-7 TaxID=3240853 RepID=UPI0039C14B2B
MVISTITFYFISTMMGNSVSYYLEPYGGNYFSFVLIGIALELYLWTSLGTFSNSIRNGQMMGTLESILITPTNLNTIIFSSSLWDFIVATFQVLILLIMGFLIFGVNFGNANIVGALVILLLSIISFSCIGIISASFIMVFKQGDPINWVFSSISAMIGGVFFPITVLPAWIQTFSYLLPLTYSLNGMRHALLQNYTISSLSFDISVLMLFCLFLLPLSLISFRYALKITKKEGTLLQY